MSRATEVPSGPLRDSGVTPREAEVLRLVGERLHNREIADRLFLSERTVESHVSALLRKLGGADRSALVVAAAGLRDRTARSTAFPRPLSSFVGREQEVAQLRQLLARNRLVTVTGPAGAGKTRLALQVAASADDLPPPVLVDLGTVPPGAPVVPAFADALGVVGTEPALPAALRRYLAEGPSLLVVDNCEHVSDAVAGLLGDLLPATHDVLVLATSRGPLHVAGEVVHDLGPLPLPPETQDPDAVLSAPAGRLFADRAAAALPGFVVTPDDAPAVATLCRRLDGLPLAIELTAARLRAFSPAELLARLDDRLALLAEGGVGSGGRHRTLETALRWSYDLLDDDERLLLERCSVFPGDFDFDALADVAAYPPLSRTDITRLFPRLLDRSLVSGRREGSTTAYRLLDTVRHFAADRLAERGGQHETRAQHARHHLRAGASLGPALRGAGQVVALRWLDRRWLDVRTAMRWALDTTDGGPAWQFLAGIGTAWEVAGARSDVFAWLDELLERPHAPEIPGAVAAVMLLCYRDTARAVRVARQTVEAGATSADERDRRLAGLALGWALGQDGDTATAVVHLRAAADAFRQAGDDWHAALALEGLGDAETDTEAALQHLACSAELFGALHDDVKRSNCLSQLALRSVDTGIQLDDARDRLAEARALADRTDTRHEQVHADLFLARLEQFWGTPDGAEFARLLPQARRLGDRRCTGRCLLGLGTAQLRAGDHRTARATLLESIGIARDTGERLDVVLALRLLGHCRAADGDAEAAALLLGAADGLTAELDSARRAAVAREDRLTPVLREALGAEALASALDAGRRTDVPRLLAAEALR